MNALLAAPLIIAVVLLCLFRPVSLLYLFFTLPVISGLPGFSLEQSHLQILRIGTINIFAFDFLIGMMICILFVLIVRDLRLGNNVLPVVFRTPLARMLLVMALWDLFIAFLSFQKGFELQNILRKLATDSLMFMIVIIPLMPDIDIKKERLFKFSIFMGLLLAGFAGFKYFVTKELEFTSSLTLRTLQGNETVIFMFPICYLLFYSDLWRRRKFLYIITMVLLAFGIHLTGHRSGYLVLLFALAGHYFFSVREKIRYLWVPAFGAAALVLILFIPMWIKTMPGQSLAMDMALRFNDTFDLQNKTVQARLSYWTYAHRVFKFTPILGLGRFPAYSGDIEYSEEFPSVMIHGDRGVNKPAHNFLVDKFLHEGLLGLVILIIFIYVLLGQSMKIRSMNTRYFNFLTAYMLTFLIFCLFNTPLTTNYSVFFYAVAGFVNLQFLSMQNPDKFADNLKK